MKRQRSKAELLTQVRIYEAMVKDAQYDKGIRGGCQYWCTEVAWCAALSQRENFSGNALQEFIRYMHGYDISELDEGHRNGIMAMLKDVGIDGPLESRSLDRVGSRPHRIDAVVNELHKFNARVMTDYRLVACEYLRKYKGFGLKRLKRAIAYACMLEGANTDRLRKMRKDIYEKTGLWLEMCEDDVPEGWEDREKEYM